MYQGWEMQVPREHAILCLKLTKLAGNSLLEYQPEWTYDCTNAGGLSMVRVRIHHHHVAVHTTYAQTC